jgi:predicted RNase H-like HicB family nuclease
MGRRFLRRVRVFISSCVMRVELNRKPACKSFPSALHFCVNRQSQPGDSETGLERQNDMQKKHAANGHAPLADFAITITPQVHKDGKWYVAFCPEVPEANGQGRTREESVKDLQDGIESIMQDRRLDARSRAQKKLSFVPVPTKKSTVLEPA